MLEELWQQKHGLECGSKHVGWSQSTQTQLTILNNYS